jgi:hypothetical protein
MRARDLGITIGTGRPGSDNASRALHLGQAPTARPAGNQ